MAFVGSITVRPRKAQNQAQAQAQSPKPNTGAASSHLIVSPLGFYPRQKIPVRNTRTSSSGERSRNGDPLHGLRPRRHLVPPPLHPPPHLLRLLPRPQGEHRRPLPPPSLPFLARPLGKKELVPIKCATRSRHTPLAFSVSVCVIPLICPGCWKNGVSWCLFLCGCLLVNHECPSTFGMIM